MKILASLSIRAIASLEVLFAWFGLVFGMRKSFFFEFVFSVCETALEF
jgi:hypothetical protein